jgi:RNA polymerase sigma factor (sigma-70 family)
MEVSALKYSGQIGLHGRSPLLRLQSDERLIALLRRGNTAAFEMLVSRYEARLQAFCRHLLGSREDAEDVLQEVLAAAFNAILADERPINVRPWLYRIARNRSLNHLRRIQAIGVDSMDHHLSEHGASTADKVHEREEFRLLVGDIQELPETQKTALVLREMDALSYDQIAEAMETTVPSVKSLLVRARVSLAEAAEARLLSCEEVRIELAEVAEGLLRRANPLVRRHVRDCKRCAVFKGQLKQTNKALAALLPVGPLVFLRKLALVHLGHSAGSSASAAGSGAGAGAAGAGAAGAGAVAGAGAMASSSGLLSAGIGAVAGKAAAGLAAAALVTAGAVEVDHHSRVRHPAQTNAAQPTTVASVAPQTTPAAPSTAQAPQHSSIRSAHRPPEHAKRVAPAKPKPAAATAAPKTAAKTTTTATTTTTTTTPTTATPTAPGRTQTQQDPTVLPPTSATPARPVGTPPAAPVIPTPPPTTPPTQTTTPTPPTTTPTTTPTPTTTTTTPTTTPTTTSPMSTPTPTTTSPTSTPTTTTTQTVSTPASTTVTAPSPIP